MTSWLYQESLQKVDSGTGPASPQRDLSQGTGSPYVPLQKPVNVEEAKNVPLVQHLMVFSWRVVLGLIDGATKPRLFIFICHLYSECVELL